MAVQETVGRAQVRRVGDFHPSVWGDFFIKQETQDKMLVIAWKEEVQVLKEKVRKILLTTAMEDNPLGNLNLIESILRLGIGYHFEREIDEALEQVQNTYDLQDHHDNDKNLSAVALGFRLLRQRGFYVSCDVFNQFLDANGNFKEELSNDVQGLLNLYEASHLSWRGEKILDDAVAFTTTRLKSIGNKLEPPFAELVTRALQRPVHRNVEKLEQLQYISTYQKLDARNETVLKLAKLDFNVVQDMYREELRSITEWWIKLDFARKMPFFRDRLIECFFWAIGVSPDPEHDWCRRILTKIAQLFTLIDDTYDVHGTIDELQLFSDTIERWDTSMENLPDYMKLTFQALLDFLKEIDEETSKHGRPYCLQYIKEAITRLIRAYMTEARWFNEGYVPEVEEHRRITGVSTCLYIFTFPACSMLSQVSEEVYEWLVTDPTILVAAADHSRLTDDITTHEFEQKRGSVASSVECYMKQYGVSKQQAHDAIKKHIEDDWKDINEGFIRENAISKQILKIFLGYARVMDVLYSDFYDGYTYADAHTKEMMEELLVKPFPST